MLDLPDWARLLLLVGAGAVLLLGIGLMTLLLRPLLCACACCSRRRKGDPDSDAMEKGRQESIDEELQLSDVTYRSWARGSLYDTTTLGDGDVISQNSQRDSTYSSMSEGTDTSSILSGVMDPVGNEAAVVRGAAPVSGHVPAPALTWPPGVNLRLHFLSHDGSAACGRLAISVQDVRNLPARDYGTSPDPCVHLTLSRARWTLIRTSRPGRTAALHQLSTRTLRRTRQPHFDEDYAIEARSTDIKDWVLGVSVEDDCRLRGPATLCAGEVRLRQHAKQIVAGEPLQLSVPLQPNPQERGLLLFGLSYLPTAQRLNISIIKATKLRVDHIVANVQQFRPYVRATLVQANSGRRVQAARTEPQEAPTGASASTAGSATSPEFCETLCLKVAPSQLATLALVVALCHRPPEVDERVMGFRRPRDRVVGAVAVGSKVSNERGREHWRAMEQRPRRVVSIWHTLT